MSCTGEGDAAPLTAERSQKLVADLVLAANTPGEESLKIVSNRSHLICHGVSPQLQSAWRAVEDHLTAFAADGYLIAIHRLITNRGGYAALYVDGEMINSDARSHSSLAVWLPPQLVDAVNRFAANQSLEISEALALLIIASLQNRSLCGEFKPL